ncbi:hypothetical protein KAU33_15645 [Candidatus Dependentiae bacterium]|nr:hypothetical protein [Candidatus Dependentiae bacterium]
MNNKGYPEPPDIRTGKAKEHQKNALKSKGNGLSNAKVVPEIDFSGTMYTGYSNERGYVEFMEIKMEISNTGKKGREGNQISMSGTEGEIMKTDDFEKRVEDYWEETDMEEEYGYVADESIGEEPSEDEIDAKMPEDAPSMDEDEDAYVDAYEIAYKEAMEDHKEKREEYLESLKHDLQQGDHPFERHDEQLINGEFYVLTSHSGGQVLDNAGNYTPIIDQEDLDFIVKSWENHHLFGLFGNDKEKGRSEPTLQTMQKLMDIHKKYESEGGDEAHVKKIVDATGI